MASPITKGVINQSINLYVNSSVIISTSDMMTSKKDIAHVFNAETFIEGFISGILWIGVTLILCIPINIIINNLINVKNIATLPLYGGIGLILLSVILTLIAGIIPSNMASKKDPVEALRSE